MKTAQNKKARIDDQGSRTIAAMMIGSSSSMLITSDAAVP
jgi:hypothetical protein